MNEANFKEKEARKLVPPHVIGGIRFPAMLARVLKSAYVKHKKLARGSAFRNLSQNDKRISDLHSANWREGAGFIRKAPHLHVSIAAVKMAKMTSLFTKYGGAS